MSIYSHVFDRKGGSCLTFSQKWISYKGNLARMLNVLCKNPHLNALHCSRTKYFASQYLAEFLIQVSNE